MTSSHKPCTGGTERFYLSLQPLQTSHHQPFRSLLHKGSVSYTCDLTTAHPSVYLHVQTRPGQVFGPKRSYQYHKNPARSSHDCAVLHDPHMAGAFKGSDLLLIGAPVEWWNRDLLPTCSTLVSPSQYQLLICNFTQESLTPQMVEGARCLCTSLQLKRKQSSARIIRSLWPRRCPYL
jgi:hypothetical protein